MIPKDWPFKGKPVTNNYITVSIGIVVYVMWLVLCFMYPAPILALSALVCLGLLVRSIYRSIRAEWT